MKYVYIAGPITKGNQFANVRAALLVAKECRDLGFFCYVPHRSALDEIACGAEDYEVWMQEDFGWISRCDALLRIPGESSGADREVVHARENNIPVFFSVEEMTTARMRKFADG